MLIYIFDSNIFPKLTSLANYPLWKVCIKSAISLIIIPGSVYSAEGLLSLISLLDYRC